MSRAVLSTLIAVVSLPLWAADDTTAPTNPDDIIQKFAAKETAFSEARNDYTYRQTVKIQELDPSGNPTRGKYEIVEDIIFTPMASGRRRWCTPRLRPWSTSC